MTQRKDHIDLQGYLLLLACCVFWGFQQVLVKATMPEIPPVMQAAMRFAGATALLWLWCQWRGIALAGKDGSGWPGVLAGVLFAGEFAALYIGLQQTAASRLTVFLYTAPFWVAALLPMFVPAERLRAVQWVGLACAFAAVVFALWGGLHTTGAPWWGDALGLGAGMLWGLTTVVIRSSTLARISPEKLLMYQVGVSAVLLPCLSWGLGENWAVQWSVFSTASLLIQTVLGAFVSYLAWMWMLGRYPAAKMSAFVFLTPVVSLVVGALWLQEAITPSLVWAVALVGVGIVLVNKK